jgi:putative heme-binding domain-containing protein
LSPLLRSEAIEVLFARIERVDALLTAVEKKAIAPGELTSTRVAQLLKHRDAGIRRRAAKLFDGATLGRRGDVVASYQDVLTLGADATRGKAEFKRVCAACHRLENVGHVVGPDLAAVRNRGAESILLAVLDPNREVNPQYTNYVVLTTGGETFTGAIVAETATSITLRRAEGAGETILRNEIDELRSTGLSTMPEGLERELDKQQLADTIAYLLSVK